MILTRCAPPRWRDALAELNEVQQILRSIVYKTNLSTILVLEKIASNKVWSTDNSLRVSIVTKNVSESKIRTDR